MYKGYVALLKKHEGKFEIVAFPCNQFGGQEPGTHDEIKAFARDKYGFNGLLMAKVDVNGKDAHGLWAWMQAKIPGLLGTTSIKWNFSKFLVDKEGNLVKRYSPQDSVDTIEKDLVNLL
eukprot:TRINITY_DN1930_c0_g1_i1.p4 TRINITY_DN1930_c0_g1~~TRINITY_DN1930_c0_g1_i1.p4  ORF type:complete len:119 (+),score=54.70 TRINITY_DN1930_c0_g1_i1:235-591(+)